MKRIAFLLFFTLSTVFGAAPPALAVLSPAEMLEDPELENRARRISTELRCMVCQNQSIDDSDAELARDLRLLVRQRILEGDSDREVMDYVVSRYGEFVLMRPMFNLRNAALWGAPAMLLLFGIGFIAIKACSRRQPAPAAPLSSEESRKLKELLDKE